jgi:hypothetical protein
MDANPSEERIAFTLYVRKIRNTSNDKANSTISSVEISQSVGLVLSFLLNERGIIREKV